MAKLHTREILDYEKSCRPKRTARLTDYTQITVGTHLHFCRYGSWHDGIVVSVNYDRQEVELIRYRHVFWRGMVIGQETWDINITKDKVYTWDYGDYCHPPSVVLTRARACFGQTGYNALRNNNDDFCRWCMAGKHTYLCINETYLCSDTDNSTRCDDGTHCVTVTTLEALNPGDHIVTKLLYYTSGQTEPESRHGIVIDVDCKQAQLMSLCDRSAVFGEVILSCLDFTDHKVQRYVYERCHMPDEVLDRARSRRGQLAFPNDLLPFAVWCKTGLPANSTAVEKTVIADASDNAAEAEESDLPDGEAVLNGAVRSGVTAGARLVEGVTAKVAVETAAMQAPRVLVRGAAEGVAAAAAIAVEGAVLAYDTTMIYKSFSRKEINKDSLMAENIKNTTRGIGAAGASVGGGAAGAAIGTLIFPGVGTLVGGIIGGVVGGISGQIGGHFAGKAIAKASRRPYENLFVEDVNVDW